MHSDDRITLTEGRLKAFFAEGGICVPRSVRFKDIAVSDVLVRSDRMKSIRTKILGSGIGGILAVKLEHNEIAHKSSMGGIRLDVSLETIDQVVLDIARAAQTAGIATFGLIVEEQVRTEAEILVGSIVDDVFGQVVAVGFGGAHAEAINRAHFYTAPLSPRSLRLALAYVAPLVKTVRNTQALETLLESLFGTGGMAVGQGLLELDLNPIGLIDGRAIVLDAWGSAVSTSNWGQHEF